MTSQKIDTKNELLKSAEEYGKAEAVKNLAKGWAGNELTRYAFYNDPEVDLTRAVSYLIDQGPTDSPSALVLGPLRYTYSVQGIDIFEERAVEAPAPTRSDRPVVVDSGKPYQRAVIRLLFHGLDEINTDLRALIALFKTAPIITIQNEMLSKAWSPKSPAIIENIQQKLKNISSTIEDQVKINEIYTDIKNLIKSGKYTADYLQSVKSRTFNDIKLKDTIARVINENLFYLNTVDYIPVCLESLTLQTIPELAYSIAVNLTVTHIDVESVSENGILTYLGEAPGTFDTDPRRAYWLKKWLSTILDNNTSIKHPSLLDSDFNIIRLSFFDKAISKIQPLYGTPYPIEFNEDSKASKVVGISASMSHRFAYHRLIGKGLPCAQHIGISSRSLSMDLEFADQDDLFYRFSEFKETSDKFIRAESIVDRVMGWTISNPLTKLLGPHSSAKYNEEWTGIFVPLAINFSTTDIPGLKNCSLTCIESNVNFELESQILLESGGTGLDDLRKFFIGNRKDAIKGLIDYDEQFRSNLNLNNLSSYQPGRSPEYAAHTVLFPSDSNGLEGIINRDTIRALFFNSEFKTASEFRENILKLPIATGKITSANIKLTTLDAFFKGLSEIGILAPGSLDNSSIAGIEQSAYKLAAEMFDNAPEEFTRQVATEAVLAMFGTPRKASTAVNLIRGSSYRFSNKFKEALFDVVTARQAPRSLLSHTYDKEGLYIAFNILYLEYLSAKDLYPELASAKIFNPINSSIWRQSVYLDFNLPTYQSLFGDKWQYFAPTYDDLGINYYTDRGVSGVGSSSQNPQDVIAIEGNDRVPPYIWFYNKRLKSDLRANLEKNAEGYLSLADKRYLSMNLRSVRQADDLRKLEATQGAQFEKIIQANKLNDKEIQGTVSSLVELITQAYTDNTGKIDVARFQEDLDSSRDLVNALDTDPKATYDFAGSRAKAYRIFYEEYLHPDSPKKINLYFTTTGLDETSPGGYVSSRFQVSPAAGAAYIRVMHELKYLIIKKASLTPAQDEVVTTAGSGNIDVQRRNLRANTIDTVKSSLSQVPDDYNSMSKLWPAAKVYLLERRGNDFIADDVFFSTDSVLSIDITDDKDDAALAVIKIADPLRFIQNATFGSGNISSQKLNTKGKEESKAVVLGNRRQAQEGILKLRRIEQGRAIQVRMGYGSNPDHLPVMFTGRITEIELGDELVIVAQGWKAELINRQVNFYSSNRKTWGAKDLVVQAIQQADPDGIGQHFPEREARTLINKLKGVSEGVVRNTLNNQIDSILTKEAPSVVTDISRLIALDTLDIYNPDSRKPGLDTRLKNVWYPDMSQSIQNFFKWRQIFGQHGPDFINDYWLVPLQPAWDVIKEASRHTWNYIAQVVPYDGEATLFFGHPDQMYYYTRGKPGKIDQWKKYASKTEQKALQDIAADIFVKFTNTKTTALTNVVQLAITRNLSIRPDIIPSLANGVDSSLLIQSTLSDYLSIIKLEGVTEPISPNYWLVSSLPIREGMRTSILGSGLPGPALADIEKAFGTNPIPILLYLFYGFKPSRLHLWPGFNSYTTALCAPASTNLLKELLPNNVTTLELTGDSSFNISAPLNRLENAQRAIKDILTKINSPNSTINVSDARLNIINNLPINQAGNFQNIASIELSNLFAQFDASISKDNKRTILNAANARAALEGMSSIIDSTMQLRTKAKFSSLYNTPTNISVAELLDQTSYLFKAFIYFFGKFIQENNVSEKVSQAAQAASSSINYPTMKVFRVHHYIDSSRDIIENNIVTTTSQMWNTVIINRPSENPSDTTITDGSQLNVGTQVKTTVSWIYWPRPAISKVIGLQFHPGLTLANKKVKVCTELNCISDELAAKLACNNLAEGMKKMYRGTLIIRGRNIKPYDRIILNDTFTGMKGPIEVESVVHHYSAETGWITNIIPQAVCDSNPGAAVIQTAIHEANYERIMNATGTVFNAFFLLTVLAAPGVGTALKTVVTKAIPGVFNTSLRGIFGLASKTITGAVKGLKTIQYNPNTAASLLQNRYGKTVTRLFAAYAAQSAITTLAQHSSNFMLTTAWAEGATDTDRAAQLPVIICPLIYNGAPWTAGMEADDILFSVPFYDTYYGLHDLKTAFLDYVGAIDK